MAENDFLPRRKLANHDIADVKLAVIRSGKEVAAILERRPLRPLFLYLRTVRAGDRSTDADSAATAWVSMV